MALESLEVSACAERPELEGRNVPEAAAEQGVDPLDLTFDLAVSSGLETRFRIPLANTNEGAIAALLTEPFTVLGLSDAGAHASQLCDACFSTHLLGRWVRDKGALTLEQAIDHLCARPAAIFGLAGRGRLAPGWAGDVVVFDPETVGAGPLERVHDLPAGADRLISTPTGVRAVVVNGTVVRRDNETLLGAADPMPGQLLRRAVSRSAMKRSERGSSRGGLFGPPCLRHRPGPQNPCLLRESGIKEVLTGFCHPSACENRFRMPYRPLRVPSSREPARCCGLVRWFFQVLGDMDSNTLAAACCRIGDRRCTHGQTLGAGIPSASRGRPAGIPSNISRAGRRRGIRADGCSTAR